MMSFLFVKDTEKTRMIQRPQAWNFSAMSRRAVDGAVGRFVFSGDTNLSQSLEFSPGNALISAQQQAGIILGAGF